MKILICEENREEIEQVLKEARGKGQERLLNYDRLFTAKIYAMNETMPLLNKHCKGLKYYVSMNEKKPNSYRYQYDADTAVIGWTNKGWRLEKVERQTFWPSEPDRSRFYWELKKGEDRQKFLYDVAAHLMNEIFNTRI
jgi:hypothetical protein